MASFSNRIHQAFSVALSVHELGLIDSPLTQETGMALKSRAA
ncbi:MAG: hypothetical protein ACXV8Q_20210 [Methylobacter sp.]